MRFVLDLEWTMPKKLNSVRNTRGDFLNKEIIQIGCVKISDNGQIVDTLKVDVCPVGCGQVSSKVTKLTGLTYPELKSRGYKFKKALELLKAFIKEEDPPIFLTWGNQDELVLKENAKFWGVSLPDAVFIDLQIIVGKGFYPGASPKSVQTILTEWDIDTDGQAHDALFDAINEAKILFAIPDLEEALAQYDPYYFLGNASKTGTTTYQTITGSDNIAKALKQKWLCDDTMIDGHIVIIPRFLHNQNYLSVWKEEGSRYVLEECHISKNRELLVCRARIIDLDEYEQCCKWYEKYQTKRMLWDKKYKLAV